MAFESIAREKALAQQPAICCPNCHVAVGELDSARPRYEKPDGVEEAAPLHYVLHPCGCKVHPEWAAAFTKELNRRITGSVPLPVCAFKPEELDARTLALEERITNIMAERDAAEGQARRRLEYYLVIAVDALMRLLPGAHNRLPRIDALDPEVEAWAGTNKMRTPPVKKTSELGYPKGYANPLAPKAAPGVVNLFGPGTDQLLKTEASLLAKEEAMHVDPAVAAAGKAQLDKQRGARQIQRLGGILSRRTLAEVFNIDISAEQEELARSVAAQAKAQPVLPAGQEELAAAGMDRGIIQAAREFMDHHTSLCLQLINEQITGQPYTDTRHAAASLVTAKRNIDQHLSHGATVHPEVLQLLRLIVPVFLPATGMVPTRPGPATGVPLPVTAADIKEDFHAQFAPSRRRIVRKKDGA
jgi:predicted MarR family transcription regulator